MIQTDYGDLHESWQVSLCLRCEWELKSSQSKIKKRACQQKTCDVQIQLNTNEIISITLIPFGGLT